jgi:hypothetical protein
MKEPSAFPSSILSGFIYITLASAVFVSMLVWAPHSAYSDGSSSGVKHQGYRKPTTRQYNDRLPPVIPGEEIVTETGQKIKTWSSAGPVPVNPRPTPQALGNGTGGIGVLVDGRERYGHDGPLNGGDGHDGAIQPLGSREK